jgi:hypothetical protein
MNTRCKGKCSRPMYRNMKHEQKSINNNLIAPGLGNNRAQKKSPAATK